jgi:hypothetical protein
MEDVSNHKTWRRASLRIPDNCAKRMLNDGVDTSFTVDFVAASCNFICGEQTSRRWTVACSNNLW